VDTTGSFENEIPAPGIEIGPEPEHESEPVDSAMMQRAADAGISLLDPTDL
jgi:hypothetical protein